MPLSKRIAFICATLAVSAVLAVILGEVALRALNIPGISYHNSYYDPVTGGKFYPNTTFIYRGEGGEVIERRVNDWGYLDVDHKMEAEPGTLRIGFFGDSFIEARQVTLEQTFFRLAEDALNERVAELGLVDRHGRPVERVETIAFGMSGRGTLPSYLEWKQWVDRVDFDWVVYVFVENDVGDQVREIKRVDAAPYPVLSADTFVVDDSFNDRYGYKTSRLHRSSQYLKAHSLLVSTLEGRLKLLKRHGIKMKVTRADMMGDRGPGGGPGMAPSSWPSDELRTTGWDVTRRVLARWRADVESAGSRFMVFPIPRWDMVGVDLDEQDAWAPHLYRYCGDSEIELVDPLSLFERETSAGTELYFGHFNASGHRAFANVFVDFVVTERDEPVGAD